MQLLADWFGNAARVLLPGRGFYIWGGYANCANYPAALKAAGLYFSQAIIWDKQHPVLTRKDFMGAHEWCFYGWREGAAHQFYGPANVPDLWAVKKVNPQSMVHLTEKPVELAVRAIEYSSVPGENVLDLFGGSGSTLIGAETTGRNAYLMELDCLYADVIVQRYEQLTGQKAERVRRRCPRDLPRLAVQRTPTPPCARPATRRCASTPPPCSAHGTLVYSPIVHSHPLASRGLPGDWAFWERAQRGDARALRRPRRPGAPRLGGERRRRGRDRASPVHRHAGRCPRAGRRPRGGDVSEDTPGRRHTCVCVPKPTRPSTRYRPTSPRRRSSTASTSPCSRRSQATRMPTSANAVVPPRCWRSSGSRPWRRSRTSGGTRSSRWIALGIKSGSAAVALDDAGQQADRDRARDGLAQCRAAGGGRGRSWTCCLQARPRRTVAPSSTRRRTPMPTILLPEPLPHQLDVLRHPARLKVVVCGRRWGKSLARPDRVRRGPRPSGLRFPRRAGRRPDLVGRADATRRDC